MSLLKLTDAIEQNLENNPLISTVTYGGIDEILTAKSPMYPLAHFVVGNAVIRAKSIQNSVSLFLIDLLDEDKEKGDNNMLFIQNTMLTVASRLHNELHRGDLRRDGFELEGDFTVEVFTERFENQVAGVAITFLVNVKNDVSIC